MTGSSSSLNLCSCAWVGSSYLDHVVFGWQESKFTINCLYLMMHYYVRLLYIVTSHRDGRVVHSNLNKLFNTLLLKMIFILIKVSYIMFLLPD